MKRIVYYFQLKGTLKGIYFFPFNIIPFHNIKQQGKIKYFLHREEDVSFLWCCVRLGVRDGNGVSETKAARLWISSSGDSRNGWPIRW